jgi:hypothetical protein
VTIDPYMLGRLAEIAVVGSFGENPWRAQNTIPALRALWEEIPAYHQRAIMCSVEVETMLHRKPIACRDEWLKFIEDLTPPKTPFTVDYRCGKCKTDGLKLWRGVHGCNDKDGNGLMCAACLDPKARVDDDGKADCDDFGMRSDQIAGWLPAVPTDDTFWGYSSVPTSDVKWWKALPTYKSSTPKGGPDAG